MHELPSFQVSRRSFLGFCTSLAAGMAWSAQPAPVPGGKIFQAGIACVDITPALGVSIAGHMHDRLATGVHDPLHVRCLVLDNGDVRLVLGMVDNCLVPRPVLDAAKQRIQEQTGISPGHVLLAATHTHTGPTLTSVFQSDPVPGYGDFLVGRIAEGVALAVQNLEPAQIAWGKGEVPDEVFNRRWHMKPGSIPANPFGETTDKVRMNPPCADENLMEPSGPTDPAVPFIALRRPNGAPLAVLANYALHYIGGTDGNVFSADYFGCFAEALAKLIKQDQGDAPLLAMMSNGASANINNINFRVAGTPAAPYERMRAVADKVAREVHARYQELSFVDWVPLAAATEDITLGVRKPNEEELERAKAIVAAAAGPEMKTMEEIYARETVFMAAYPDTVPVLLQALRIGDTGIAAIPCEVFVEIGLALKAASPFPLTFPIELANGYNGYLPTVEQHALGGYETWRARSSYLEVAAAEKIQETMLVLMNKVKG
jgi:neutral ceramidase